MGQKSNFYALLVLLGVLETSEAFNANVLKEWIIKVVADYFYKQYSNPDVKSCFSEQHQEDIDKFKPYHLSFVEKLKSFYFTL